MTELASTLLSKLVDINWELNNNDYPEPVKIAIVERYWKIRDELIEVMGEKEFITFMEHGRRMFAPAD